MLPSFGNCLAREGGWGVLLYFYLRTKNPLSSVMVVEWLKFKVNPQSREKFIQKDEEIWTSVVAKYPGFLGKEVWIDPEDPEEIIIVIRWASREQWKSVPQEILAETEGRFAQEMGGDAYEMLEAGEYQIRKFPHQKS